MPRRASDVLSRCARIASRQYGVISRAQAVEAGLSRQAIARLVAAGTWIRVRPNVFALWVPSRNEELWRQRLKAAELWLGPHAAVSHRASALVSGLDGIRVAPLELSTAAKFGRTTPGLIVHRVKRLDEDEIVERDGLAVTSVPRTIADAASVVSLRPLELMLESALRLGVGLDDIRSALD